MPDELTGAMNPEDAAQEINPEEILLQDDEETGEETEEADAGLEGEEESEEQAPKETRMDKAFAAKWKAQKDKLREEIAKELREELKREAQPPRQHTPQPQIGEIPPLPDAKAEQLAEQLNTSPEHVRVLYSLQMRDILREREIQDLKSGLRDNSEKAQAQAYVAEITQKNPAMPGWDEKKLAQYRQAHGNISWQQAYDLYLADLVKSGELTRKAEQNTIQNIKKRDTATVKITAPSTKRPTVDDLSDDQFERLVEEAKSGKFKRS